MVRYCSSFNCPCKVEKKKRKSGAGAGSPSLPQLGTLSEQPRAAPQVQALPDGPCRSCVQQPVHCLSDLACQSCWLSSLELCPSVGTPRCAPCWSCAQQPGTGRSCAQCARQMTQAGFSVGKLGGRLLEQLKNSQQQTGHARDIPAESSEPMHCWEGGDNLG